MQSNDILQSRGEKIGARTNSLHQIRTIRRHHLTPTPIPNHLRLTTYRQPTTLHIRVQLFSEYAVLPPIHTEQNHTTVDLRHGESDVEKRSGDLKHKLPPRPQAAKQIHCDNRLDHCPDGRGDAGEQENSAEEVVSSREDAVEDNGYMGTEFGYEVEGAWDV